MANEKLLCIKNPFILVKAEKQPIAGQLLTLEGQAIYMTGDFIVTGIANEQWIVKPDKDKPNVPRGYNKSNDANTFYPSGNIFKTYEFAEEQGVIKQVWDKTGNTILKYEVGDALITHGKDDIGICNSVIFNKTYLVGHSKQEILEKLLKLDVFQIQELNKKIAPNGTDPINLKLEIPLYYQIKNNILNLSWEVVKNESNVKLPPIMDIQQNHALTN